MIIFQIDYFSNGGEFREDKCEALKESIRYLQIELEKLIQMIITEKKAFENRS